MKCKAFLPAIALLLASAAAAEPPLPPDQESEHVVQPGETLYGIANRAKVPHILIAEANGLQSPYLIRAGQTLTIPRTKRHQVAKGETGFAIAFQYGVPWHEIATANSIDPDAPIKPGQNLLIPTIIGKTGGDKAGSDNTGTGKTAPAPSATSAPAPSAPKAAAANAQNFAWPLTGPIRRGFTERSRKNYHDGLDITAPKGAAVRASAEGKVIFAGTMGDYGKLVVLDHGGKWYSAYGFLSRITVKQDEKVRQGERIGMVGNTGLAKGYELHFELRRDNKPVDPGPLLPKQP